MQNTKKRSLWFWALLVLSYVASVSYAIFLSPDLVREAYGVTISSTQTTYWLASGLLFTAALVGVTCWKKVATYIMLLVIASDATVSVVILNSFEDFVFNVGMLVAWLLILKRHWRFFS